MGIMVESLFWAMQDLCHPPYRGTLWPYCFGIAFGAPSDSDVVVEAT